MSLPKFGLIIIGDEILSGKRQDQHLQNLSGLFKSRGLSLNWVKILSDEPSQLVAHLKQSFASGDIVFCCGGIGATPDDRTRQSAAAALGLSLKRHPEAVKEIEAQFGEAAYPQRIKMAEYPEGARIIPNGYNRVPGFSIANHFFMPGFPVMTEPMMAWVLDTHLKHFFKEPDVERSIRVVNGQEGEWVNFMEGFEKKHPQLRLFSLPRIEADDTRTVEIGVEGQRALAEAGIAEIIAEADQRNLTFHIQQL